VTPQVATDGIFIPEGPEGEAIRDAYLADEHTTLVALAAQVTRTEEATRAIVARARAFVEAVRAERQAHGGIESFLQEYDLATPEGVLLMCIAEALLRIPDTATADALIRDKLSRGDWERHLGASDSLFVNASTWGLMLTGRLTRLDPDDARDPRAWYERFVARAGEPVVRVAVRRAMTLMAEQFVIGRTIEEAVAKARVVEGASTRHSYDMLGESAVTASDARRYFDAYRHAIAVIGAAAGAGESGVFARPSISVKLSALHPRYEYAKRDRVFAELVPALVALARDARERAIGMTIDAEEAERLELSLAILARVRSAPELADWQGLGLAVQAYQKRARAVVGYVVALARRLGTRIPVRLVKGAYWDTEIKRAQVQGLAGYPVFTRKPYTDVCYLACARALLEAGDAVYPMFATHNAHTIAWVMARAADLGVNAYEFQRLHGMGEALYRHVHAGADAMRACRVYAPVGGHHDLLPYLVRRLLENGANTSFVNRIGDPRIEIADVVADPLARARAWDFAPSPRIPLPADLFAPERRNSQGVSLADQPAMRALDDAIEASAAAPWRAAPIVGASPANGEAREVFEPADRRRRLGSVVDADGAVLDRALSMLAAAQPAWDMQGGAVRAEILDRAADRIEAMRGTLVALLAREAGKTRSAAIAEVREAADFCRYYAVQARAHFGEPVARTDGRGQHPCAPRTGRLRVHLAVELPARDLHRPGRRRAGGRKRGGREARGANADHRGAGRAPAARGRRAGRSARAPARTGRDDRRAPRRRSPRCRRRVHWVDRRGKRDCTGAGRADADRAADRGDRRAERDDRRQLGARGAGGRRRPPIGVRQRRTALLGAARAVCAGGRRAARARPPGRCDGCADDR
jgi:RHH-type proline utilization regulon transcriptional repressor/proline dehydrogenase/delta 1-pyrroline-5-carboxylate dehydrogenase